MATSKSISLQVSDIVRWFRDKELVINETFQRHSVWTTAAKTYLVDTVLNELPIPKIYIRSKVDTKSMATLREVVDGQQRVRSLVEFASNQLRLGSRSDQFTGLKYEDLDEETQSKFLGYTLSIEQLLNASDDDVIDIFARLNSYIVSLNAAEKRHAQFQTEFKFAVRKASHDWRKFWEGCGIFSTKQRFRMADDVLVAELFGLVLDGVTDGGSPKLENLYRRQSDEVFKPEAVKVRAKTDEALHFISTQLGIVIQGSPLAKHYHIYIMVAAYLHQKKSLPKGELANLPESKGLASTEDIRDNLLILASALEDENPPIELVEFVDACSASTHRIASRRVRFRAFCEAFAK